MENSNQCNPNIKFLTLEGMVFQRLDEIEEQLQRIFWFIEFHLGEVPLKYRKAYPKKGEYPYFNSKQDLKMEPLDHSFSGPKECVLPSNPQEYKDAIERMKKCGEEKKSPFPDLNNNIYCGNYEVWVELMAKKKLNPNSTESWVVIYDEDLKKKFEIDVERCIAEMSEPHSFEDTKPCT